MVRVPISCNLFAPRILSCPALATLAMPASVTFVHRCIRSTCRKDYRLYFKEHCPESILSLHITPDSPVIHPSISWLLPREDPEICISGFGSSRTLVYAFTCDCQCQVAVASDSLQNSQNISRDLDSLTHTISFHTSFMWCVECGKQVLTCKLRQEAERATKPSSVTLVSSSSLRSVSLGPQPAAMPLTPATFHSKLCPWLPKKATIKSMSTGY